MVQFEWHWSLQIAISKQDHSLHYLDTVQIWAAGDFGATVKGRRKFKGIQLHRPLE